MARPKKNVEIEVKKETPVEVPVKVEPVVPVEEKVRHAGDPIL